MNKCFVNAYCVPSLKLDAEMFIKKLNKLGL